MRRLLVRGPLIVTGLSTDATPFLRYRVGDVGTLRKRPCECGRPGQVFLDGALWRARAWPGEEEESLQRGSLKTAGGYLQASLLAFMIGRFVGTAVFIGAGCRHVGLNRLQLINDVGKYFAAAGLPGWRPTHVIGFGNKRRIAKKVHQHPILVGP